MVLELLAILTRVLPRPWPPVPLVEVPTVTLAWPGDDPAAVAAAAVDAAAVAAAADQAAGVGRQWSDPAGAVSGGGSHSYGGSMRPLGVYNVFF